MKNLKRIVTIFRVMFKIGMFTFGGGWSIIAQIQAEFSEQRGWLTEEQIVDYMSLAKSFPGIMIINMSVFCGYAMGGVSGAVAAAFGLSTPALLAIAAVTYLYASIRDNVYAAKILNGIRSVVVPIMISGCVKLWKPAMKEKKAYIIFLISLIICTFTGFNKLILVGIALLAGLILWKGEVAE